MTEVVIWTGGGQAAVHVLPEQMSRCKIWRPLTMSAHNTDCADLAKDPTGNKMHMLRAGQQLSGQNGCFILVLQLYYCVSVHLDILF